MRLHAGNIRLPHCEGRPTDAEVSEICARVAAGDRSAEAKLLSCMTRRIVAFVDGMIARRPRLHDFRDDLLEDAALSVIKYARRYKYAPKGVPAPQYLERCARFDCRIGARAFVSPVSARVLAGSANDLTDPVFREYVPLGSPLERGAISNVLVDDGSAGQREAERIAARRRVRQLLSRLRLQERKVIELLFGIPTCRASTHAAARRRAMEARPRSPKYVGWLLKLPVNRVIELRDHALASLSRFRTERDSSCESIGRA